MKENPISKESGTPQAVGQDRTEQRILGLSVSDLAGISVSELVGNETAIKMVMHYYKQLTEENGALRNDINTLNTYVVGYNDKRNNSRIGAALLAVSNICIGFGVNLLTIKEIWPGLATFIPGITMTIIGIYFSLRSPK